MAERRRGEGERRWSDADGNSQNRLGGEREGGLYTAAEGAQRHRGECCGAAIRQERSSSPTHQPAACSQVSKTRQSADLSPS